MKLDKLQITLIIFLLISGLSGGEYGDSFLRTGVSARSIALGNSIGILDTTETGFLSNPAGLAYQKKIRLGFMYTSQFGLADYNYLGLSFPVFKQPKTSLTVSWIRFQVDDIFYRPDIIKEIPDQLTRRDSVIQFSNKPFQTFKDQEEAIFISLARLVDKSISFGWKYASFDLRLPIGLNFKILRKQLANNKGIGLGMDLGTGIKINANYFWGIYNLGDIYIGLNFRDFFGTTIYWNSKKQDNISPSTAISLAFVQPVKFYKSSLSICTEFDSRYSTFHYGVEFSLLQKIAFRAGVNEKNLAMGVGLKFPFFHKLIRLDYSFKNHDLGAVHRIGGGLVW